MILLHRFTNYGNFWSSGDDDDDDDDVDKFKLIADLSLHFKHCEFAFAGAAAKISERTRCIGQGGAENHVACR